MKKLLISPNSAIVKVKQLNSMNIAYFYDSDLSGNPMHNISSSILVEGDDKKLEKFAGTWKDKIDDDAFGEKLINDTFVNLLIDLSICVKDKNNISLKLLVFDNIFFDFLSFLALFTTDKINLVKRIDIYQEYSFCQQKRYFESIDKIASVEDLKQFAYTYALDHDKNSIIKETLMNHDYSEADFQVLKSTNYPKISKYAETRVPFYLRMFKLTNAKKIFIPYGGGIDVFCSLFKILEKKNKTNKIDFDTLPQGNDLFRVLAFVSSKINEFMYEFLTRDLDKIDMSHKHAIVLIWGLWLGTAFDFSMIPQNWILKYKAMLKDVFDKDILKEINK